MSEIRVSKAVYFEAAHYFPQASEERQRRVHGHSFRLEVSLGGELGLDGRVEDFGALAAHLEDLAGELDHGLLNEKEGLQVPTLENLCIWVASQLRREYGGKLKEVSVSRPSLDEVCVLRLSELEG